MALLLGVVGIYGVISYSVSQRTREIGIRIALGAPAGNVQQMFVRHGLLLTGIGVACGIVSAVAVTRLLSALLFGVSPVDLVTYAVVSLVLVIAALLASYFPARRATIVDPVEALRAQ
jgi:ABC-type antimicrobial peptide transport system permease subunit